MNEIGSPSMQQYDAVIIGAGLGGLLAGASLANDGRSVLILDRLRYIGGRFTTVPQDGCEITTGALHMVPHGNGGPLAHAVRELGLRFDTVPRDAYASFFIDGSHIVWKHPWDILRLFGPMAGVDLVKIVAKLKLYKGTGSTIPFSAWLSHETNDVRITQLFESFIQFALSVRSSDVTYIEMRSIFKSLLHYGMPGIPVGGCREVVNDLASLIRNRGGEVITDCEVIEIITDEHSGRVTGVRIRDRGSNAEKIVQADVVVSNIGPEGTERLVGDSIGSNRILAGAKLQKTAGLKLHMLSDKSLIPHNGIMFCLDTKRISGMVEVSRAVPSVAPRGMHMIDTFQVWMSDDFVVERDLAIADLRYVFGDDFDRHCRVVRTSAFRSAWPVNHAIQGHDLVNQQPIPGLFMVGDAYKPAGHIMVEGVAASVSRLEPLLVSRANGNGAHDASKVTRTSSASPSN